MVGAVGFMFMCCHLESGVMIVLQLFITLLTWAWKDLVGLALEVRRPFPCIKSSILDAYCVVGMIKSELPLSALAIIVI